MKQKTTFYTILKSEKNRMMKIFKSILREYDPIDIKRMELIDAALTHYTNSDEYEDMAIDYKFHLFCNVGDRYYASLYFYCWANASSEKDMSFFNNEMCSIYVEFLEYGTVTGLNSGKIPCSDLGINNLHELISYIDNYAEYLEKISDYKSAADGTLSENRYGIAD